MEDTLKIDIKQEIKADDLLQNTSWHGETTHDNQSVENLKALNVLVTDLIQKVYWQYLVTKCIAENQGNHSAKLISDEAKAILINAVKMATDEEDLNVVDKLFNKE